jgi:CheY-like chemotaxis protein
MNVQEVHEELRRRSGLHLSTGAEPGTGPQVGSVLGRCLLTEQLGKGTSGLVFRALHQTLNIPVAVKILRPDEQERDRQIYFQLRDEAQLLAQLNHPHIVRVLDFEDNMEMPYLVLEYVEGLTLAELIQQSGRLQPDRALRIVAQVADGLGAAWKLGIIHRDVKPGNILIDKHGNAKLADLGQAVLASELIAGTGASPDAAGTPAYIAPEQMLNPKDVTFRADIYSLGATLYHAVTGRMPFTGRSAREVMIKQVREPVVPPHHLVPGLDRAVSDLIVRMLAKDPSDRFGSANELMAALTRLSSRGQEAGVLRPSQSRAEELLRKAVEAAKTGNKQRANSLFKAVTELEPKCELAWQWLASVAATPAEAVNALEKVLALNAANERARAALQTARLQAGYAEIRSGNKKQARAYLLPVVQQDPNNEQAWLGLAAAAEVSSEAESALERVLALNPGHEVARQQLNLRRSANSTGTLTAKGKRVLVVDDSATIRKVISIVLSKAGYQVLEAVDGYAAVNLLRDTVPDLILLDITMPGIDGYQVCKVVRSDPRTKSIPVIMLSGKDGFFDKIRGRMAGSSRYLTKPCKADEVLQAVREYCPV